jgi:hypothetical protein
MLALGTLAPTTMVRLGKPLAPPRLTRGQAVRVAEARAGREAFTHPFTIRYGSLVDRLGAHDVWAIRVEPLGPPLHVLLILIEDKTTRVLRTAEH